MGGSKGFKKFMAMAYGLGGAVVILGALFKLMHWEGSGIMLVVGLGTEAFIFIISAFEPLPAEELDWSIVYPELSGGNNSSSKKKSVKEKEPEGILSQKIDEMLEASNIDAEMFGKLSTSIDNFSSASKVIGDSVKSVADTEKYNRGINTAAIHLEKINSMYENQGESMTKMQSVQDQTFERSEELTKQMESLSQNISSLNNVYGGMLSAMGK